MPEPNRQRPRTVLIVISMTLALCIPAATWVVDYMGRFGMFSRGVAISDEVDAEVSRRGVHCTDDSKLIVSDGALDDGERLDRNRRISSFSLLRSDGSTLEAEVGLTRIEPSAPWLEGVREGEAIRIRFRCVRQKVLWCVETDGFAHRFHGPPLHDCPASAPASPIRAGH